MELTDQLLPDLAVQQFLEAGGGAELETLLSAIDKSPLRRDILHLVACLTAFCTWQLAIFVLPSFPFVFSGIFHGE